MSRVSSVYIVWVQALVFGAGDLVSAETDNEEGMRFLLVAGRPIGEPIVQHGYAAAVPEKVSDTLILIVLSQAYKL